jgi:hypothetical protein
MAEPAPAPRRSHLSLALLAVPQVILFGGMLVMLVVHPNAVKSGVMSTRAVVVNAVLLAGWLLLSFVILPRVLRNVPARAAVLSVLAIAAVVVLVVPTLVDKKVVEAFPMPEAVTEAAPGTTNGAPGATGATTAPAAATEPVRVSTGVLRGIDHDATGDASIFRVPNGPLVVALEDIDIEPGPDYRVYLVRGIDRESPGDGIELAGLRGNQGTQYYEVPADVTDAGDGWTVLVWCRAFGVPVANSVQHAVG